MATLNKETAAALAAAKEAVAAAEARSLKEAEVNYFREVLLRAFETKNPSVVLPVAEKLLRYFEICPPTLFTYACVRIFIKGVI